MSLRTSFIGIVAAATLITALVAGLVQARESAQPSRGDTIEVSPSSPDGDGRTKEAPSPRASSAPAAEPSVPATAGGDAVPPPPVPPGDDDDNDDDDDDDDDG